MIPRAPLPAIPCGAPTPPRYVIVHHCRAAVALFIQDPAAKDCQPETMARSANVLKSPGTLAGQGG